MKRTLTIVDGRPVLHVRSVSADEASKVEALLADLSTSTNHKIEPTIDMLRAGFQAGSIGPEAVERLSRWANTAGTFASAIPAARALARALMGCVPERLIDEHGTPVSAYASCVRSLTIEVNGDPTI